MSDEVEKFLEGVFDDVLRVDASEQSGVILLEPHGVSLEERGKKLERLFDTYECQSVYLG